MRFKNNLIIRCVTKTISICLLILGSGCTSVNSYVMNRAHDAADIVTIAPGVGLGANIRVGPFHAGAVVNKNLFGLRCGELFSTSMDRERLGEGLTVDATIWGIEYSKAPPLYEYEFVRQKYYCAVSSMGGENKPTIIPFVMTPSNGSGVSMPDASYYSQIMVAIGVGPSVQIGFNPLELLDFLLGLFGVDILEDDVVSQKEQADQQKEESKAKKRNSNPTPSSPSSSGQ